MGALHPEALAAMVVQGGALIDPGMLQVGREAC